MASPWRYIAESRRGPSHEADGAPCQDASLARLLGEGDAACLVACVADGAGSAKHSDVGSEIACRVFAEQAAARYDELGGFETLERDEALVWVGAARQEILAEAERRGCPPRDLATTLLAAILGPGEAIFLQIGDGAIIAAASCDDTDGPFGVVFWPQSGEYANTTNFLTGEDYEQRIEFQNARGSFAQVALLTDGLERLALVFDQQTPHAPFCQPLFAGLRAASDVEQLGRDLGGFLESESVCSRSDDDKSLILAIRG